MSPRFEHYLVSSWPCPAIFNIKIWPVHNCPQVDQNFRSRKNMHTHTAKRKSTNPTLLTDHKSTYLLIITIKSTLTNSCQLFIITRQSNIRSVCYTSRRLDEILTPYPVIGPMVCPRYGSAVAAYSRGRAATSVLPTNTQTHTYKHIFSTSLRIIRPYQSAASAAL